MEKYEIIKLLADKNRFKIFNRLMDYDELAVSEIESLLGMKQANTSKHLRKFKDLGILESRRDKNMIKYKIKEGFLNENMDLIKFLMF